MISSFEDIGIDSTQTPATCNVHCEENNGILSIFLTFTINNIDAIDMGSALITNANVVSRITLKSDATSLREISMYADISGNMVMDLADMMDNEEEEESSSLIISMPVKVNSFAGFYFSNTYDSTFNPISSLDPSEFVGTGVDNAVENRWIDVDLCVVSNGKTFNLSGSAIQTSDTQMGMGLSLRADDINNYQNIKWYKDKACTQEFTGALPSYDITLYAKLEDIQLREGYALYTMIYTYDEYDESDLDSYLQDQYISISQVNCTVDDFEYAYVNGVRYENGASYTLDPTKVNIVYGVWSNND